MSSQYENTILLGDFNYELKEEIPSAFREVYDLKNLIKELTCFKNTKNLDNH